MDTFGSQGRHLFDVFFEDADIGTVTDDGRHQKADEYDQADQDVSPQKSVLFQNKSVTPDGALFLNNFKHHCIRPAGEWKPTGNKG